GALVHPISVRATHQTRNTLCRMAVSFYCRTRHPDALRLRSVRLPLGQVTEVSTSCNDALRGARFSRAPCGRHAWRGGCAVASPSITEPPPALELRAAGGENLDRIPPPRRPL